MSKARLWVVIPLWQPSYEALENRFLRFNVLRRLIRASGSRILKGDGRQIGARSGQFSSEAAERELHFVGVFPGLRRNWLYGFNPIWGEVEFERSANVRQITQERIHRVLRFIVALCDGIKGICDFT